MSTRFFVYLAFIAIVVVALLCSESPDDALQRNLHEQEINGIVGSKYRTVKGSLMIHIDFGDSYSVHSEDAWDHIRPGDLLLKQKHKAYYLVVRNGDTSRFHVYYRGRYSGGQAVQ